MVVSRRRFAENLKEMHGIKKKHVKGVQNFCFCQLSMQILWRRCCSRAVDLKLPSVAMGSPVRTNILIPGDFKESWVMTSKNIDDFHTRFEQ